MNALPVYDRCMKIKGRTCNDEVYTNFRGLNVSEDGIGCESVVIFSVDSLLVYENKYYLQAYLVCNYAYKIVNTQTIDYLDDNLFMSDEN